MIVPVHATFNLGILCFVPVVCVPGGTQESSFSLLPGEITASDAVIYYLQEPSYQSYIFNFRYVPHQQRHMGTDCTSGLPNLETICHMISHDVPAISLSLQNSAHVRKYQNECGVACWTSFATGPKRTTHKAPLDLQSVSPCSLSLYHNQHTSVRFPPTYSFSSLSLPNLNFRITPQRSRSSFATNNHPCITNSFVNIPFHP